MAFGLFKDGEELFDAAVEEINRKEYEKAAKTLQKALDKNTKNARLANVYIAFINVGRNLDGPAGYTNLSSRLSSLGQDSFRFGLTTFDTQKLIKECDAMAKCINARNMGGDKQAKGNAMIEAARGLIVSVGNETLSINEHYSGHALTGMRMANALMAEGNELLALDAYWNDPQKAAEYQQQAYNYRRQNGESGEENLRRMQQYSKACTCWICGRQVVGEGMHFFQMDADPSPQQVEGDKGELQRSMSDNRDIYVCRACYTSISRRADAIAKDYYNQSIAQLRDTEARLHAQIIALDSRISRMQSEINMLRH